MVFNSIKNIIYQRKKKSFLISDYNEIKIITLFNSFIVETVRNNKNKFPKENREIYNFLIYILILQNIIVMIKINDTFYFYKPKVKVNIHILTLIVIIFLNV